MAEPAAAAAPVKEDNDYVAEVALDDETTLTPEDETPKEEVEKEINSLEDDANLPIEEVIRRMKARAAEGGDDDDEEEEEEFESEGEEEDDEDEEEEGSGEEGSGEEDEEEDEAAAQAKKKQKK